MKPTRWFPVGFLALAAACTMVQASDRTAIYARVDRVVLEPNNGSPQAIQVWGVFSLAKPNDRNDYLPAARGYLYFKLPAENQEAARKEWADLKQVAGTREIVAFGAREQVKPRLRKKAEKAENPDPYVVNFGVSRVRKTDYAPVRALLDYKD